VLRPLTCVAAKRRIRVRRLRECNTSFCTGARGLRGYVLPAERIAAVDKTGLQEGDCMAASDIASTL